MFKSIKRLIFSRPDSVEGILKHPDGKRYYREQHTLRRDLMDEDALKVINRLNRNGFRSYLVGGCVRDMLLERRPKDYDVVTTATPAQIRNLFSNSRAIGRRFKIVHVIFRGKIIEVSTFRSLPEHRLRGKPRGEDLLIKRDNEYGSPREDAARRDFTINALYFDPRNESIIDYVGGLEDIRKRRINVIGDPTVSFQEDPVRMLRAAKFSALLGMEMSSACLKGIRKNREYITRASPSRMLEEYIKIFRTGQSTQIFGAFAHSGLLKAMFPESWETMEWSGKNEPFAESSMGKRLAVADRKLTEREDLTTNIFMAIILADVVRDILSGEVNKNIAETIKSRLRPIVTRMQISGKDRDRLIQIFTGHRRFWETEKKRGFRPDFFRKKPFFFEAFMLFKIDAIARGDDDAVQKAMFWEIGVRPRPPEPGKIVSLFMRPRYGGGGGGGGGERKGRVGRRKPGEGRGKEGREKKEKVDVEGSEDNRKGREATKTESTGGRSGGSRSRGGRRGRRRGGPKNGTRDATKDSAPGTAAE